ncbi:hypothetical protein BC831DRAFT_451094 [Entophlyctis helioformis]|nr:hypothetical protein BC831DRAFT_451094 [Entophlyctis helioformis]
MPQSRSKQPRVKTVTDKIAGLESHQFSRDEHRFAALPGPAIDVNTLPRQPRVGNNSRNTSDGVFKFGGPMAYPKGRAVRGDVAKHEKLRLQAKRDKIQDRKDFKREWLSSIEKERWENMSKEYVKNEELWKGKHSRSKLGSHSVHYNPITLEYHQTDGGRKLAADDAKAMHRTAVRATRLYLKNNSFDPTMCTDIPRKLEAIAMNALSAAKSAEPSGNTDERQPQPQLQPSSQQPHAAQSDAAPEHHGQDQAASKPLPPVTAQHKHVNHATETHNVLPLGSAEYTRSHYDRRFNQSGPAAGTASGDAALLPPRFGRRSYKILQNTGSSSDLRTPRALYAVATSTADLVQERAGGSSGAGSSQGSPSALPKMPALVIEAEGSQTWVRHY